MRTRLRLREAALDDLANVVALIGHLGYPVSEDAMRQTLTRLREASEQATIVVAELDGVVCGLLVLGSRPSLVLQGTIGIVQELVVGPAHRRREIGEALLQYAKGIAVERGFARLECAVPPMHQPAADRFFLERGFEIADTTTYRWSVLEGKHPRLPVAAGARRLRSIPA